MRQNYVNYSQACYKSVASITLTSLNTNQAIHLSKLNQAELTQP